MKFDALTSANVSRRNVVLGGLVATVAAGLPAAVVAQTTRKQDLSHASKGAVTMSTITSNDGTAIFYKDWGPKNAQPIVFHHGWPLSSDDWDTQMLYFVNKGYRVIAHDRRGHGRSAQVSDGHDMDHYAADAAAVVEHLDLRNAVHIGHSTGGGEATHYVAAWSAPGPGRKARADRRRATNHGEDAGQSGRPPHRSVRRLAQGARRQPGKVLPRFGERSLLQLQPAGREANPRRRRELVAAVYDGERQGRLRRHQGLLGDRFHRGSERSSTCRHS